MTPHHLRIALRRLRRAPGFTALTLATLTLAVGANVAIFALVNALFLRPLPVAEPERLVGVYQSRNGAGFFPLSLPDYRDVERESVVFDGLAAHYPTAPLSLRVEGGAQEEVNGSVVSAGYFDLLGVEVARGRFFRPEEGGSPGAHPVAVISHQLWRTRFGGREDVVGTVVEVNSTDVTVVGVAPEGFEGVLRRWPSHLWLPISMARLGYRWCDALDRGCTWLTSIGRLAAGRSLRQARAEMELIGHHLRAEHGGGDGAERSLRAVPLDGLHPAARGDTLRLAGLLLAAVTLVVLVAGANLGGLLLARGLGRRREVAVRLALGAGRAQAAAGFVAETALLALAGGAGGLLLATWLGRLVAAVYPGAEPLDVGVDATVAVYALSLCLLSGLLIGLIPALRAARPDLRASLGVGRDGSGGRRSRLLAAAVVLQVALCFVLLSGTGLLARSLAGATAVGDVDPDTLVTVRLRPRLAGHDPQRAQAYTRRVVRRLRALPGVEAVGLATGLPPFPFFRPLPVAAGGDGSPETGVEAWVDAVGPGTLETLGLPLLRGRGFDVRDGFGARDAEAGPPVVVVSRLLADTLWPDRPAVGEQMSLDGEVVRVIGVFDDRAWRHLTREPVLRAYTPYWGDRGQVDARLWVRTAGDGNRLIPTIAETVRGVDPAVPVTEIGTLRDRLDRHLASVHLAGRVLAASGVLALTLSAVGLFGVLALAVARRRREIGIRMALGSDRARVVGLIYRDALLLVGAALALGLAAALLAGRALEAYLYGVGPRDPLALTAAALLLALIATLASCWPAYRASRVDPLVTLRAD